MNLTVNVEVPEKSLNLVYLRKAALKGGNTKLFKGSVKMSVGHRERIVYRLLLLGCCFNDLFELDSRDEIWKDLGLLTEFLKLHENDPIRGRRHMLLKHFFQLGLVLSEQEANTFIGIIDRCVLALRKASHDIPIRSGSFSALSSFLLLNFYLLRICFCG